MQSKRIAFGRFVADSFFTIATIFVMMALTQPMLAQTYTVIHNFTGGSDGANPASGLTIDRAGNFYGTASTGGVGYGTVFKLVNHDSAWLTIPLYSFTGGDDGAGPFATMTLGSDGRLYGTTQEGGGSSCGGNILAAVLFSWLRLRQSLRPGFLAVGRIRCSTLLPTVVPTESSLNLLSWFSIKLEISTALPQAEAPGNNGIVYKLTRSSD